MKKSTQNPICFFAVFFVLAAGCAERTDAPIRTLEPSTLIDPSKEYLRLTGLNAALTASHNQPVLLFKHSNTCPISAAAKAEMDRWLQESSIPVYMVVVQTERPMSNKIEEHFQIKHESPQLLIVENGQVRSVFNHSEIRRDHLAEAL